MGIRYQYRQPETEDYVVARTKLLVYIPTAIIAGVLLQLFGAMRGHDWLWGGLLAHSILMVLDATTVTIAKEASVNSPSLLNYFLPCQNPRPDFGILLDILALGAFGVGVARALFGYQ